MEAPTVSSAKADFEAIFKTHYERTARAAHRVLGDLARAEEVAAEAFWKLHRSPPPSDTHIAAWLHRVAVRLALDALRREKRRRWYEALIPNRGEPESPLEALEKDRAATQVRRTLAQLRSDQAELLLLRSDGFSYAELATQLGLNPASIGTMLSRAEAQFEKEYRKLYGNPQ